MNLEALKEPKQEYMEPLGRLLWQVPRQAQNDKGQNAGWATCTLGTFWPWCLVAIVPQGQQVGHYRLPLQHSGHCADVFGGCSAAAADEGCAGLQAFGDACSEWLGGHFEYCFVTD